MIFLEDFYGISEGVLWELCGILMGFPLDFCCISMMFLPVVPHEAVAEVSE